MGEAAIVERVGNDGMEEHWLWTGSGGAFPAQPIEAPDRKLHGKSSSTAGRTFDASPPLPASWPRYQSLRPSAMTAVSPLPEASVPMAASSSSDAMPPALPVESYDPHPTFKYSGPLRPAYPLSKNKKVPAHIVKPNYAREEVRQWFFAFWWDVRAQLVWQLLKLLGVPELDRVLTVPCCDFLSALSS